MKTTMGLATGFLVGMVLTALPSSAQMGGMGMSHDPLVSADWLESHLSDAHAVVLHAEMQRERYEAGHVPGARFLDMTRLVWDGDPAVGTEMRPIAEIEAALEEAGVTDGHHHVIVYADNPLYAARAFMTLEVMGLRGRVQMLDGGLGGWREEGRALTTDVPDHPAGDVTLTPRDDVLVDADWIHQRLDDERFALVDARPDEEYTGADGGMGGRVNPGHIPGARQMYWEELIDSRAVPRLHERDELRALFEQAGAAEGDTVVAYCMVGWRASFTYFAARLLGYETRFYDGSWRDWGAREDLPYVVGAAAR